jgi:hypothetical protein
LQLGSKTFLTNLIHLGLGGLDVIGWPNIKSFWTLLQEC